MNMCIVKKDGNVACKAPSGKKKNYKLNYKKKVNK